MISLYLRRLAVSVPAAVLILHRRKPVQDEKRRNYPSTARCKSAYPASGAVARPGRACAILWGGHDSLLCLIFIQTGKNYFTVGE